MANTKKNASTRQEKRMREDIASFKASVAFLLFCAVVFFTVNNLQFTRGSYHVPVRMFFENNPWVVLISVALLVFGCIFRYTRVKSGRDESMSYLSSEDVLAITLFQFLFVATFLMTTSIAALICVIVGFAVVYYVRYFFEKDFLLTTLLNCDIAMALWLIFGSTGVTGFLATAAKIVFATATALGFFACLYALLKLFRSKDKKLSVLPCIISVAFGAVLGILLLVSGGAVTVLMAEIILLAQFLGLGIYYTVKLLNQ